MRQSFNISIVLILLILVFDSCKEEEESILGCTDSSAMNYSADATSNDGSCLVAYDIAQGEWNINPNCDDLNIPLLGDMISLNDMLPESINVDGTGGDIIFIEINDDQVEGTIDNQGNILVSEQTLQLDMGLEFPISVSGTGLIIDGSNGIMSLIFSFDVPLIGSLSSNCEINLTK